MSTAEVEVFFSLGSNIEPRGVYLAAMRQALFNRFGTLQRVSSVYETAPWGFEASLPFLNQVVSVRTAMSAQGVLREAQSIEAVLGRERMGKGYASRTADIDILLYGDAVVETVDLQLPHSRMAERRFVLAPLAEVHGEGSHSKFGKSWRELLDTCMDSGAVERIVDPSEEERRGMVRLVADGGATAVQWLAIDAAGHRREYETKGLNPLYVGAAEVAREACDAYGDEVACREVGIVEFYGASCGPNQFGSVLVEGLRRAFPLADVHVDSDMVMAMRATWGMPLSLPTGSLGAVAILGTGSNACYVEAGRPRYVTPSVGFLLGDEGSGAWFGKRLIRDWLYGTLPCALARDMHGLLAGEFGEEALVAMRGMESIVARAYHGSLPSAWFGGFARVMVNHRGVAYVEELLDEGFGEFAHFFLAPLKEFGCIEVRAVGSVAWYYQDALRRACESVGMRLGKVVRAPLGEVV